MSAGAILELGLLAAPVAAFALGLLLRPRHAAQDRPRRPALPQAADDARRLVARLSAMPWYRAKLPAVSALNRRSRRQRPPTPSRDARVRRRRGA